MYRSQDIDPQVARYAFDLGNLSFANGWVATGAVGVCAGLLILSADDLPRWLGWWAIAAGVGQVLARAIWTQDIAFVPFVLYWLWTATVCVLLLAGRVREGLTSPRRALPDVRSPTCAQRRTRCQAMAASAATTTAATVPAGTRPRALRPRNAWSAWLESTDPLLWWDRAEPALWFDNTEAVDIDDKIDAAEANEPTLAKDAHEAALPIESTESWEQIDRTEFSDHRDSTLAA